MSCSYSIVCVQTISEPVVRSMQAMHLFCTDNNTLQMDQNEIPFDPRHLGVLSGASKMIPMLVVRAAQTVQLSCIRSNSISKWTEMRLLMTHVTLEYPRVRLKGFLSV
jgi:hypothetical protein